MTPRFTRAELQCKCGCGLARFHPIFLEELQALRDELGEPMRLTSACRCTKHNTNVKGHPNSLHRGDVGEGAMAVDVATPDGAYRGRLFALAWKRGWSIGWNDKSNFLHLDRRVESGRQQTTFGY